MGFDLFLWSIDAPIDYAEASKRLEWMLEEGPAGPLDARLSAFMDGMQARFPEAFPGDDADEDWQPARGAVMFEMNEEPGCVFLGIPFSSVARVGAAAQAIAALHDLVILDPQSEQVYLPPRFGGADVDWGMDPTAEELAAQEAEWMAEGASMRGADSEPFDEAAAHLAMLEAVRAEGGSMWSPAGYEITSENILESMEDPTRTPSSLQTPEHKADLIGKLSSPKRSERAVALDQLSGWDPDPEVADALRSLLRSDDDNTRWVAAAGIARQGATDALDDVLEVVRRASPSDGGSIGQMLLPTRYALELADRVGPEEVTRVKKQVSDWRGPPLDDAPRYEREWAAELDDMLG